MQESGGFRLVVRRGPQPNQVYELNKDVVALGRDITNDIVINDPEVSRHHCRMTRTQAGYTLEDLGSTNGSFINGQRVTGTRQLQHGDTLGLGETVTLAYEGGGAQAAASPMQQETIVGAGPPQPQAAPAYSTPDPYAQQQQPDYQQPQQAQPQYSYPPAYAQQGPEYDSYDYPYEEPSRNTGRLLLIGCGCLGLVCIFAVIIAGIIIDFTNSWCYVPLVPDLFDLACPPNAGVLLPFLLLP